MSRLLRGIFIVWVVLRHGLDELVLSSFQHPWLRRLTRIGGESSLAFVNAAIDAAMRQADDPRRVDAVVTAPIAKTSWHLAGLRRFPGHTELLAERTKARRHAMMFVAPRLRVVLATMPIGVLIFPGTGIQDNLADKARKLGIPVYRFGTGSA